MFYLEKSIVEWRNQMRAAGIAPAPMEELETHLREDINHLVAAGKSGEEAFCTAAARVGKPRSVVAEFDKTKTVWPRPMMIGSLVWTLLTVAFLAFLVTRYVNGRLSLLLVAHIFTVTAGYCTAFLAGAVGIYHVLGQRFQTAETTSVARAISLSTQLAAVLVVVGLVTSMIWSNQNLGHLWTKDPREIGGLSVAAWLAALSLIQSPGRLNLLLAARLSIIGNMLVALAWFGARELHQGYGITSYWPLDVFLGVHLFLLGMTATRGSNTLEA
jgi:hypothetical protein